MPPAKAKLPVGVPRTRWDDGALSPEQAAAFSGLTRIHILRAMRSGKLTYADVPGSRNKVIPVQSLRAYLAANAVVTEGEC
jgi:hypothetical protein